MTNHSQTEFLPNPAAIRQSIHDIASKSKSLDLAVAFIGPEWERLLTNYQGPIRAICWLTHPATDPDAVKSLMRRKNTVVRQRSGLHTKVYLASRIGAVIGSANLSYPALVERAGLPQCEAAVCVREPSLLAETTNWFNALWNDGSKTAKITDEDLERARKERKNWPAPIRAAHTINPVTPPPEKLPVPLFKLAKQVEGISLKKTFKGYHDQLGRLLRKSKLSAADVSGLADSIAKWTKHRAVYKPLEKQSRKKTRDGLRVLFDEGRDIYDRLNEVKNRKLLRGLQIPAMSLLLYWWRPDACPPYNAKTERFLRDFRMATEGMSASSPACYATWLGFADLLRARLHLPSAGHVDRVVSKYYDSLPAQPANHRPSRAVSDRETRASTIRNK